MSKKQKNEKIEDASNYYGLHTDAVKDLVEANEQNSPEVSEKELKKYKSNGFFDKIPVWVKALFLKFWFAGAVCFFFFWGLSNYLAWLDAVFVMGFALGVVTDLLTNNIFKYFESTKGEFNKWIMIPHGKFWTLFLNIVYSYAVLFIVITVYGIITVIGTKIDPDFYLGVEPIMFGLLYLLVDMLFIGAKNLLIKIFKDANDKTL
ncbi:MAG: hypothetical protein KBS59_04730 [Clostridiales bacterium]|nr:hypothetical protein [Clostridiales bacterium]